MKSISSKNLCLTDIGYSDEYNDYIRYLDILEVHKVVIDFLELDYSKLTCYCLDFGIKKFVESVDCNKYSDDALYARYRAFVNKKLPRLIDLNIDTDLAYKIFWMVEFLRLRVEILLDVDFENTMFNRMRNTDDCSSMVVSLIQELSLGVLTRCIDIYKSRVLLPDFDKCDVVRRIRDEQDRCR